MTNHKEQLNAGPFSSWLEQIRISLHRGESVEVPCGICAACCTSGFYIAISKQETASLDKIPEECLFEIPGVTDAVYIGCDDQGNCHLLNGERCQIYEHRPVACRTFDCRIYTATGIEPDKESSSPINQKIQGWKFEYPTKKDHNQQLILKAAAAILGASQDIAADNLSTKNSRIIALRAIMLMEKIRE